jgi:transcription-repair coupling factor (superfamily II helicase)
MTTPLRGILPWIREHPAYASLLQQVQAGGSVTQPLMIPARPAVLAALIADQEEQQRLTLVIVPDSDQGRRLRQALRLWLEDDPPRLFEFPEPPTLFDEHAPWPPEVILDRVQVLALLALQRMGVATSPTSSSPPIFVTSARALMQRTLPYRQFRKAVRHLRVGERVAPTELARHAVAIGYEPVSIIQAPGQVSRRGGILDLYPVQARAPYRIEFFGDEIDTIRAFDPETQRSTPDARVTEIWLTPAREALPGDGERAVTELNRLLHASEATGYPPPELRQQIEQHIEHLSAGMAFPSLESYLPYIYEEEQTLLHYFPHLPGDGFLVVDNLDRLSTHWLKLEQQAIRRRERATKRLAGEQGQQHVMAQPHSYVRWASIRQMLNQRATFQWARRGRRSQAAAAASVDPQALESAFTAEPHFAGRLPEALGRVRQWINLEDRVVIASRQAARLAELWREFNPPPVLESLPPAPEQPITFVQCAAPGGWQLEMGNGAAVRHLLTDEELFGWRPPEPRRKSRRRAAAPAFDVSELTPGDTVVHEDYGVGVFRGLVIRAVDEIEREYIQVAYAEDDRLFVPVDQADRLTRYVGVEGRREQLSRLDSARWQRVKARTQEAADELADELLDLYAARQIMQGYAFSADTDWQRELEAAFPYQETEDQLRAIEAVKRDMEQPRPMDRLICGDAGYGKTEVALRAAFKAAMDNKQVAMLVPTTVLAQQHHQTFITRLASYPVQVELLSRFRTGSEQRKVLHELREGTVDIVIGTHRLLQKDIAFKDLGLVIIDEEQRFGVAHKERLKQMRTQVDVLTLSATPIPRTLYMALTGARDISIIETPPQERVPITNYVGPYDTQVVRRAVLREINRGGQIFYVHNRVETIRSVEKRLQKIVPEATIGVAHGQMRENKLSEVMLEFTAGKIDLLLATTIIESGLDIPNANTLIIEHADHFGLAQLYQLRGRVGRGNRRGYAYFFPSRRIKLEAQDRLEALQDTTSIGGGFSIALRDLELRGAGELLGRQQHGHVAAVGFTLYTQMLEQAVENRKAEREGQPPPPPPIGTITIDLPLAVGLPPDYIADAKLRLRLYRRLAAIRHASEIDQFAEELRDRFGALPEEAQNLMYQLELKVLARNANIPNIAIQSQQITLQPAWDTEVAPPQIARLRRRLADRARLGRNHIWLALTPDEAVWRENLLEVLRVLARWRQQVGAG